MGNRIIITGMPGCGKSTLIDGIIKNLEDKKIAGIITPEIRKYKARQGFRIIDLASKQEQILASINIKDGPRVGKYRVNINGIDKIVERFLESYNDADIIVLDELGPMEFYSKRFKELINMIFESDKTIVAVVHRTLVNKYKENAKVFYLERQNFNETLAEILTILH